MLGSLRLVRPARVAALLCLLGQVSACVGSKTRECSWGAQCPADQVCFERDQECVYPAQLEQCAGRPDHSPCIFPGAEVGAFTCQDEVCRSRPVCGDGTVEEPEQCDGTVFGADGTLTCVNLSEGFTGGALACDEQCLLVKTGCSTCGDGRCEPAETLDDCPQDCRAASLTGGADHSCITLADGTARCWGLADDGQLGNLSGDLATTPEPVYGVTTAVQITAGALVTCALVAEGRARCWGDNTDGALGDGNVEHYDCGGYDCGPAPTPVANLLGAVRVAAGDWHVCALLDLGQVRCWGDNEVGQVGDGTREDRFVAVPVHGIDTAQDVAAGSAHSCALLLDGTVRCWGYNAEGELGDGDPTVELHTTPVAVLAVSGGVAIGAGSWHSCAVLQDGRIRCWGYNEYGQLGDASVTGADAVAVATQVVGINDAIAVTAGQLHTCALHSDATVSCWGSNGHGQLGTGDNVPTDVPVAVPELTDVVALSAGDAHTCALRSDDSLWCWGLNESGQLGDGSYTSRNQPVRVVRWSGEREFEAAP